MNLQMHWTSILKNMYVAKKMRRGGGLALASGAMCMTTWNVFYHYYSLVAQDYIYSRDNSVRFRVVAFNRAQIEDETGGRTQVWSVPEGIPPKLIISMSYSTLELQWQPLCFTHCQQGPLRVLDKRSVVSMLGRCCGHDNWVWLVIVFFLKKWNGDSFRLDHARPDTTSSQTGLNSPVIRELTDDAGIYRSFWIVFK